METAHHFVQTDGGASTGVGEYLWLNYCSRKPPDVLQWRIQQLSGGWGKWRKSLIVERASRRAVEHHRQLLLKQVSSECVHLLWRASMVCMFQVQRQQIYNY